MTKHILNALATAKPCSECGAKSEFNGLQIVEIHHMGCAVGAAQRARDAHQRIIDEFGPDNENPAPAPEDMQCEHPGCTLPKRLGRGTRPTQYCEEHSTNAATLERRRMKEAGE